MIRGIGAAGAHGARGRTSHNPSAVGSSPTRPTCDFATSLGRAVDRIVNQCRWSGVPSRPRHEPGDRPARVDALQARADEAVHRIAAGNAAREARAQYTARLEREAHAQAEPAAERQAEALDGIEIEL